MATDHDPVAPSATAETSVPPGARAVSLEATYRRLVYGAGLRPREAASLLGRLQGLPMVPGGWTLVEVERLLFVLALVAAGRLRS